MNNKIVKTVDEHNIDRDANVMFAFDLSGSEYVSYRIGRDEEQDNIFVSKVIKNIDGTYNMINIDYSNEKAKLNSIVMSLVESAVKSPADKLAGDAVNLSDGTSIKFMAVNFNKEQRIEVRKTYVTTVKKEVSRVAEKYYDVVVPVVQPQVVDDIFPTVIPASSEVKVVMPEVVVATPTPTVVETPAPVTVTPIVETPVVTVAPSVTPVPSVQPATVVTPEVVASTPVAQPATVVSPVVPEINVVQPQTTVVAEPMIESNVVEQQPLVFNASKEVNLNAALGEVANTASIPVENISPVKEFGVDEPIMVVPPTPVEVASEPVAQPNVAASVAPAQAPTSDKAGFANSKFFMLVAVAFFLASCVFLGYEVFNYFQLTK